MLTSHQSNPLSGGDIGLGQALALLEQKRENATQQRVKFEQLVTQWSSQEADYSNTIRILRNEFGSQPNESRFDTPSDNTPEDESKSAPLEALPNWVKPVDTSWLDLLRNALREIDSFASQHDITDHFAMNEADKLRNSKSISAALTAYRKEEHLVGITVYSRTTHGKAVSQILTGLPEFFENPLTKQLKPEYERKLIQKVKEMHLYLSEEEATRL